MSFIRDFWHGSLASQNPAGPRSIASSRFGRNANKLIFIGGAVLCFVILIIVILGSRSDDSDTATTAFPVGSYKYQRATYITLRSDGTFNVRSDDDLLWSCLGRWTFSSHTLNMQADADESRRGWIPYVFCEPATLISNGKDAVVWDCMSVTFEWKKLDH